MINLQTTDINNYISEIGKALPSSLPCPLIAIDDGYDQTNSAYWTLVDGQLTILEDKIKSRGKRGRHVINLQMKGVGIFASGDDVYTIRDTMDHEDTRTDDFPKKPLNRFLVHAALEKAGIGNNTPVAVVTGLPLKQYMPEMGQINKRLIDAKRENMLTPVTVGVENKPSAKIIFHGVFPEAIAGLADYLIDNNGKLREGMSFDHVRMVLDIGGRTTDIAIILPGNDIGKIETINWGVSNMRDNLRKLIEDKLDLKLDSMVLDEALMNKSAHIFGDEKDFSEEWDIAVSNVLREIFSAADEIRKEFPSIREMICFGGGAALCEEKIRIEYPSVKMVENPDGANARGYLKFATMDNLEDLAKTLLDIIQSQAEPVEQPA